MICRMRMRAAWFNQTVFPSNITRLISDVPKDANQRFLKILPRPKETIRQPIYPLRQPAPVPVPSLQKARRLLRSFQVPKGCTAARQPSQTRTSEWLCRSIAASTRRNYFQSLIKSKGSFPNSPSKCWMRPACKMTST